ncbi:PAS domain S-box-containing protein [Deinococcus metalli]|uniref:histidine kinase n=1 Tax=Deinococcus metalli TaxID=1141878 RepID=A0A7W8KH67_9DEIO|nr:ATP-binding protein [Deinococcus metalli]MBB5378116.1 PAS domain S-box-containing protein [Deinococcus metalli]GHF54567.1 hypothetical protein GCM10017781_33610 [Deinococcus metalli]
MTHEASLPPPDPLASIHTSPAPTLLLDAHCTVQDANDAACALLGRASTALIRRRLATFVTPGAQGTLSRLCMEVVQTGSTRQGELQLLTGDRQTADVLTTLGPLRGTDQPSGYYLVMTDITAYKQAHRDLLDQTAAYADREETQAASIRASNVELTQVMLAFVQQLNLPLGRAHAFLAMARQSAGPSTEPMDHALQQVDRALQEIVTLMTSVSGYTQLRVDPMLVRPVKLESVLRSALSTVRAVMAERDVHVTHDPLPTVLGDSRSLQLIFAELLGNALKYTRTRKVTHIHISVREDEQEVVFGVEDNGVGFNMRHKDRLFRLFGRLHSAREYEGTGVGLLSVRWVVERAGGRVWAEGKPDQGATFFVAWPKVQTSSQHRS